MADELTREESDYYGRRLALFASRAQDLAQTFLDWYALEGRSRQLGVEEAFDQWSADLETDGKRLTPAERGVLLFAVTHTAELKVRVLLADGTRPDKFTGARERPGPTEAELTRLSPGGDLERREGEPADEHLERIAAGLGMVQAPVAPVAKSMPAAPVAGQGWLPYKDPPDEADQVFDDEGGED